MRTFLAASLAALALGAGCVVTSGQFLVSVELPDGLSVTGPGAVVPAAIDLNTIDVYNDHKEDVQDVADAALLGTLTNLGLATDVECWMTTQLTTHLTAAAVRADPSAVRVWGPLHLDDGQVLPIGWDESAGLFTGRANMLAQAKGDGQFSLYFLGPDGASTYSFRLDDGVIALTIDAGM